MATTLGIGGAILLGVVLFRPIPPPSQGVSRPSVQPGHAHTPTANASLPLETEHPSASATSSPGSAGMAESLGLSARGKYAEAAELAADIALPDLRSATLVSVFSAWAREAPSDAAQAALAFTDSAIRTQVWHAIAVAWAEKDAPALAAFAWDLDDATAREAAFATALPAWLEHDESAALKWIGALPSSPQTDAAVAVVALHPPLLARDPELAVSWAESIGAPALRSRTLGRVSRAWQAVDPDAAERYARSSPELFPSEREDVLVGERFTAHP